MNWIEAIKNYVPCCRQEESDKEAIFKFLDKFDDVLTRDNKLAHMTSSAFVVNKKRNKVLMVHHNIYNTWSWTGGHADGEENLLKTSLKELNEETGIKNFRVLNENMVSLDILPVFGHIKNGEFISPHLHFNAAYLVEADENEQLTSKPDENSGAMWIDVDEIFIRSNEEHMKKVYCKILSKLK